MLEIENIKQSLSPYEKLITEMRVSLDVDNSLEQIKTLEEQQNDPSFWEDVEKSTKVLQEIKSYQRKVDSFLDLETQYSDLTTLVEMSLELDDDESLEEIKQLDNTFKKTYDQMYINTLFTSEFDSCNCYLTLHAGAGGPESCDWVSMLLRMYRKWLDTNDYKSDIIDILDGEEAGIKSVTLEISGFNAYGYLKSEKGVHRLVRISPFDSSGRRHTSFASCDIMPIIENDEAVEIRTEDLRVDTFRASGAGGQHINTTDSAIRITHIPTGVVVSCQNERSQHKNKDTAMKMLRSKLYELKMQEQKEKIDGIRGEVKEIGFGSQIRSYVFHPYNLVKDHRTSAETGNTGAVMDGGIDLFINAYLQSNVN